MAKTYNNLSEYFVDDYIVVPKLKVDIEDLPEAQLVNTEGAVYVTEAGLVPDVIHKKPVNGDFSHKHSSLLYKLTNGYVGVEMNSHMVSIEGKITENLNVYHMDSNFAVLNTFSTTAESPVNVFQVSPEQIYFLPIYHTFQDNLGNYLLNYSTTTATVEIQAGDYNDFTFYENQLMFQVAMFENGLLEDRWLTFNLNLYALDKEMPRHIMKATNGVYYATANVIQKNTEDTMNGIPEIERFIGIFESYDGITFNLTQAIPENLTLEQTTVDSTNISSFFPSTGLSSRRYRVYSSDKEIFVFLLGIINDTNSGVENGYFSYSLQRYNTNTKEVVSYDYFTNEEQFLNYNSLIKKSLRSFNSIELDSLYRERPIFDVNNRFFYANNQSTDDTSQATGFSEGNGVSTHIHKLDENGNYLEDINWFDTKDQHGLLRNDYLNLVSNVNSLFVDITTGNPYVMWSVKVDTSFYEYYFNYTPIIETGGSIDVIPDGYYYNFQPGVIYKQNVTEYFQSLKVSLTDDFLSSQGEIKFLVDRRGKNVWIPTNANRAFKRGNYTIIDVEFPTIAKDLLPLFNGRIINVDVPDVFKNEVSLTIDNNSASLNKKVSSFGLSAGNSLSTVLKTTIKKAGFADEHFSFPTGTPTIEKSIFCISSKSIANHVKEIMTHFPDWVLFRNHSGKFELKRKNPNAVKTNIHANEIQKMSFTESSEFYNVINVTSTNYTPTSLTITRRNEASIAEWGEVEKSVNVHMLATPTSVSTYADNLLANASKAFFNVNITVPYIRADLSVYDVITITEPYILGFNSHIFYIKSITYSYDNGNWSTQMELISI